MRQATIVCALTALCAACGMGTARVGADGFDLDVIVDGVARREHHWRGKSYVEAVKGREYALRIRNPLGVRLAVALSVDGLNTIDARRTTASAARKWVLGPYETVTISGWQTSTREARRFFFTSEEKSYAGWLGSTTNLGIISAVFFRERPTAPPPTAYAPERNRGSRDESRAGAPARQESDRSSSVGQAAPAAEVEDYAATGIGEEIAHRVTQVSLDLDPTPVAQLDLRYEFHDELVRLGVLRLRPDPGSRRGRARGFEPGFSPVPPRP